MGGVRDVEMYTHDDSPSERETPKTLKQFQMSL
jgi:hypothetical protein